MATRSAINKIVRVRGTASRYFHTLRYLRPGQFISRLRHHLYRPRLPESDLPGKRLPGGALVGPRHRPESMTGEDRFVFLNESGRIAGAGDWNDPDRDKLWLYNAHYFDDLNAHDADARRQWHRALVTRWIAENPPTAGNGWEPYPISLRAVNWIKWDLRTDGLEVAAVDSLALQLRWLRRRLEYHLLGNHLLANAKALIFGGLYFEGDEADEWFRTGKRIFNSQLREQILADGGHFELSPMYHLIVLEDLLDVINVCQAYGRPLPEKWSEKVKQMLAWADAMRHPDGEIPFFNDAAFGISGTFDELSNYADSVLPHSQYEEKAVQESRYLDSSGYVCLRNGPAIAFFDVAAVGPDYLPGHAHADTLSLELSLFGQRLLVNSGTSVYGTSSERLRQRSTDAHNTIMIDDENSSEVWGGFRVARRARPRVIECSLPDGLVVAEHDGYRRLVGRPVHQRAVQLPDGLLHVTDTIKSDMGDKLKHFIQGAWHLHPEVTVTPIGLGSGQPRYKLHLSINGVVREAILHIEGADRVDIEAATWHPEFGRSIPNQRIVFSYRGPLPATINTELRWDTT